MKIYTKTGDKGVTSLIGGERVGKDDPRVEAYGTADELAAVIACLRDRMDVSDPHLGELSDDLMSILNTLMRVQAALAAAPDMQDSFRVGEEDIRHLESRIDRIYETLPPVRRFTIPGGHPLVSLSHLCRTVCRRAERCAVRASREYDVDPGAMKYLNRLSDYLYGLGRKLALVLRAGEQYWEP